MGCYNIHPRIVMQSLNLTLWQCRFFRRSLSRHRQWKATVGLWKTEQRNVQNINPNLSNQHVQKCQYFRRRQTCRQQSANPHPRQGTVRWTVLQLLHRSLCMVLQPQNSCFFSDITRSTLVDVKDGRWDADVVISFFHLRGCCTNFGLQNVKLYRPQLNWLCFDART